MILPLIYMNVALQTMASCTISRDMKFDGEEGFLTTNQGWYHGTVAKSGDQNSYWKLYLR